MGINFTNVDLSGANLKGTDLQHSYLVKTDFHGATLTAANLDGAFLRFANIAYANLQGAQTEGADFTGVRGAAIISYYDIHTAEDAAGLKEPVWNSEDDALILVLQDNDLKVKYKDEWCTLSAFFYTCLNSAAVDYHRGVTLPLVAKKIKSLPNDVSAIRALCLNDAEVAVALFKKFFTLALQPQNAAFFVDNGPEPFQPTPENS